MDGSNGGAAEGLKPRAASETLRLPVVTPRMGVLGGTAGTAGSAPAGMAAREGARAAVWTGAGRGAPSASVPWVRDGGTAAEPEGATEAVRAGGAGWAIAWAEGGAS